MKQHITEKQYMELADADKAVLFEWAYKRGYLLPIKDKLPVADKIYPLLTIGQMIEFLDEQEVEEGQQIAEIIRHFRVWELGMAFGQEHRNPELCDALWEAVKEILQK